MGEEFTERDAAAWDALVRPCGVDEAAARDVLARLARLHAGAGRFYHTLDHVREVLAAVGELAHLAADLPAVRFAAWFHDAVYDTRARDNEERSAALCEQELTRLGVPRATVEAAAGMIRATRSHQPVEGLPDCRVLLDADLAILGSPPPRYAWYADAIRREYAWVPEAQYRAGRARVLEAFLRRERIYLTEPMHAAREEQARRNLRHELGT